jgi:hypothetical protein
MVGAAWNANRQSRPRADRLRRAGGRLAGAQGVGSKEVAAPTDGSARGVGVGGATPQWGVLVPYQRKKETLRAVFRRAWISKKKTPLFSD